MRLPAFRLGALAALLAGALVVSCQKAAPKPPVTEEAPLAPSPGMPWFEDVTAASGIDFHHFGNRTDIDYIQETMGSGLAWIDYNNDGWLDLLCIQDCPVRPAAGDGPLPTNKLYRNNGDGTFTDVTEQVGLGRIGFGMGCAVGDFDNDGFDDLVVTYLCGVVLYHNEPDGKGGRRFVDVTAKAGLHDSHWATSCAWGDIDGDGFLDLYVCNYVEVDMEHYKPCEKDGVRLSCPPTVFPHVTHQLFRNNGNGTFTDISKAAGISSVPPAPGLGLVMIDLDGDGLLDIYVVNDMKPAYLFHNQGKGRFEEKALLSGCALGPRARMVAGMGVDAGDIDGSGWPSFFLTNFQLQGCVLFRNQGQLRFQDWSTQSGVSAPTVNRLGFGALYVDVDLDGTLDVAIANGHVYRNAEKTGQPFTQQAQLFLGDGNGHFREVSDRAGGYFRERHIARALAWADYNNDGRPDLVYGQNGEPIALLRNRTENSNGWIRLELVGDGKKSNRNAIGSRVEIEAGGVKRTRFVYGGGSYLSASERRLLVGLGSADCADKVTVIWPSGQRQVFTNLPGRKWWRLFEGKEQPDPIEARPAARS